MALQDPTYRMPSTICSCSSTCSSSKTECYVRTDSRVLQQLTTMLRIRRVSFTSEARLRITFSPTTLILPMRFLLTITLITKLVLPLIIAIKILFQIPTYTWTSKTTPLTEEEAVSCNNKLPRYAVITAYPLRHQDVSFW